MSRHIRQITKSAGIASAVLFVALVGSRPVAASAILRLDSDSQRHESEWSAVQVGWGDDFTIAEKASSTARLHAAFALEELPGSVIVSPRSESRMTRVSQEILATPVPEPASLTTLGLGLIALSMWGSRRSATNTRTPRA